MEKTIAGLKTPDLPELPKTKLDEAQDLMWDAWDTRASKQRVAMARRALAPDCADAYVMLAEETARSVDEALEMYEKGVAAGGRALGPKPFEEDVGISGVFWKPGPICGRDPDWRRRCMRRDGLMKRSATLRNCSAESQRQPG